MSELTIRGQEDVINSGASNYLMLNNPTSIIKNGRLFEHSRQYILQDEKCAEYFLEQCQLGLVELEDNIELMNVVTELYSLVRVNTGKYYHLKGEFENAVQSILVQLEQVFPEVDIDEFFEDSLESYNFLGPGYCLNSVVARMRSIAYRNYLKTLLEHKLTGTDIGNLHGHVYLEISEIRENQFIEYFGPIHERYSDDVLGLFSPVEKGWIFSLLNFGLSPYNFIFLTSAYNSLIPYFQKVLDAKVELIKELDD